MFSHLGKEYCAVCDRSIIFIFGKIVRSRENVKGEGEEQATIMKDAKRHLVRKTALDFS
jgi:hypothetical protein